MEVPLLIALTGSAAAGWIDLRTTEIPDEIPLSMGILAVLWGTVRWLAAGSDVLLQSLLVGGAFFGLGFLMYYTGQWGGGDAKLLAGIGLLVPVAPELAAATLFPFPVTYLFNVFVIGAVYIVIYAALFALQDERVTGEFMEDVRGGWRRLGAFTAVLSLSLLAAIQLVGGSLTTAALLRAVPLVPVGLGLYLLWRFLKITEEVGFYKEIDTGELREGDMLGEDVPELGLEKKLIRGLTEEEIEEIREEREGIEIREGVRFGPVFFLALAYTVVYGDALAVLGMVA